MSSQAIADKFPVIVEQAPMRVPLGNLLLTFALAIVALGGAGLLWGSMGHQILIVAMGWPHIILGFIFYFGKVLRGEWRARSTFVLLVFGTLVLWFAHYTYALTAFIAVYFTYHVFRDEVFIYFQTRARHKLKKAVTVAGLIPFIALMFLITDPRPQHYRQDLRRVDLADANLAQEGWTLISFEPIPYSRGQQFYFYVQTPNSDAAPKFTTNATVVNSDNGEIRISDRTWKEAADLLFQPHYAGQSGAPSLDLSGTIPVSLKGGHRVGQTFTPTQDNLDGIWLPTRLVENAAERAHFGFHLTPDTAAPWPPLSPGLKLVRLILLFGLLLVVLWKVVPEWTRQRSFWIYFVLLVAIFAALQKLLRVAGMNGIAAPVMFQLVVVFHYWSWYVFSVDKLRATSNNENPVRSDVERQGSIYDRIIGSFSSLPRFIGLVLVLNLISAAGVLWFTKLQGPAPLRYVFDYSYFLYFLVLHVTFSFAPKWKPKTPMVAKEA
jgi:hypothetical protein